jgi:hypothetical protein
MFDGLDRIAPGFQGIPFIPIVSTTLDELGLAQRNPGIGEVRSDRERMTGMFHGSIFQ